MLNDTYIPSTTLPGTGLCWRKAAILLLSIFLMEGIFSWILVRNSVYIEAYTKIAGVVIYAFMLWQFNHLLKMERVYILLFSAIMLLLVFESLSAYNTFFRQLTMFTVLFPVVYVIFINYLARKLDIDILEIVARFYVTTYLVFMLLFGRGFSFSLESVEMDDYGPFSGDSRIMHASHVFMLIIPLLWYLHRFITAGRKSNLTWLLVCVVAIIIHQHRSVWSSALIAISIYCVASMRTGLLRPSGFFRILIYGILLLSLGYFFASNLFPGITDFLGERFSEILNPAKEGSTGNFRIEQREVYFELFKERPVFGWTFEGFEMENPLVDWWPEMTGQHFHEGYIEMLFYHGIVGLLLKYSFLIYFLYKIFSKNLSADSIILLAFCISGLVFSLNYVLPLVFWALAGICLYYLRKDRHQVYKPQIIDKNVLGDPGIRQFHPLPGKQISL